MNHTAAVLTVSDGVSYGSRQDDSGVALAEVLTGEGFSVVARRVVPDEIDQIASEILELASIARLVVTTGGTGFGPRDVTPEATRQVIEREAPGMAFLMIKVGLEATPLAALSRGIVGSLGSTLVMNLPGSPQGALENLGGLLPVIPHALQLLAGDTEHSSPSG